MKLKAAAGRDKLLVLSLLDMPAVPSCGASCLAASPFSTATEKLGCTSAAVALLPAGALSSGSSSMLACAPTSWMPCSHGQAARAQGEDGTVSAVLQDGSWRYVTGQRMPKLS